MRTLLLIPGVLAAIVLVITQALLAIKWLYRKTRDAEITQHFIHDMGTNHLRHIYHVETLICQHLGIEVSEPPPIQFVDLNDKRK